MRACAYKVTYDYRIVTVNININQDVLCTYIEHGADCLEIYVLFAEKCYNWYVLMFWGEYSILRKKCQVKNL